MALSLTTRVKVAILCLGLLISILAVAIISDTWGIRSYTPKVETGSNSNTVVVVPPGPPGSKPRIKEPNKPFIKPKPNTNPSFHAEGNSTDSEHFSESEPPSPGGGGGGGGGGKTPDPIALAELKEVKQLFKVDTPAVVNLDDPKIIDSDFVHRLPDMPLRASNFFGVNGKTNSCYANSTLQALYRIPFIRKVVANLDVYYERAKRIVKEKTELVQTPASLGDAVSDQELRNINNKVNDMIKAASVIEGLNHMFYQLHTSNSPATFNFERAMQCMPDKFARTKQEDAEEYFTHIIGSFIDFLPVSQHHYFMFDSVQGGTEISQTDPTYSVKRAEKVEKQSRITLDLKTVDPKVDEHGVPIVEPDEDLDALITTYFQNKLISDVTLENGTKGKLDKYTRLANLPEIFIIRLERVIDSDSHKKNSQNVLMPFNYDFGKVVGDGKSSAKYRLKMFIEHRGTSGSSGHYVMHHQESDGKWKTYDDSRVYDCPHIDDTVKQGYFYFYERMI